MFPYQYLAAVLTQCQAYRATAEDWSSHLRFPSQLSLLFGALIFSIGPCFGAPSCRCSSHRANVCAGSRSCTCRSAWALICSAASRLSPKGGSTCSSYQCRTGVNRSGLSKMLASMLFCLLGRHVATVAATTPLPGTRALCRFEHIQMQQINHDATHI